ncbi:MAG TPA: IreB family regulatory phosphoprotein [Bacilli bacterium]|nr:IreB family regulatory phosphoprotein [Bacilli bacterium]
MGFGETKVYNVKDIEEANIVAVTKEVADILEEKGYDPINQIVGYLMSGDPGYISSYKDARKKLTKIDRTKVLEVIVREFVK